MLRPTMPTRARDNRFFVGVREAEETNKAITDIEPICEVADSMNLEHATTASSLDPSSLLSTATTSPSCARFAFRCMRPRSFREIPLCGACSGSYSAQELLSACAYVASAPPLAW